MSTSNPSGQQGLSTKLSPRELLQECLESAVRVAFIRSDLEFDADSGHTQEEIANDAACACFGEDTESDEPVPEVSLALTRIEAFDDMLAALKDAAEELHLLRMKDTQVVYNPGLRSKISLVIAKAEGRL